MSNDLRIFFARSKLRLKVLKKLSEEEQIAVFLAKELNKHRETISRIFKDLKQKELIECTNEKASNFRRYKINKKGIVILNELTN